MLLVGGAPRRLTTRRTLQAATAAGRWQAFKRYLERLEAAGGDAALQPGGTWDELLVYAVALGMSDQS